MKITKKGEYALKALLALAAAYGERSLNLRQISRQESISYKFLEQIMILLKKNGFVTSTQGKFGGYSLTHSPKQITLGQVIRAVEGPIAPIGSAAELKKQIHADANHPGLYCAFLEVRDAISQILDHKTLADIREKSLELCGSKDPFQMYYI